MDKNQNQNKNKKNFQEKNNYKTILLMFGILSLLMLAVMPNYTLQYLFGYGNIALRVIDITAEHRMFLYVGIGEAPVARPRTQLGFSLICCATIFAASKDISS